ncbi:MAG: hypothetical protein ACD_39C01345G0003, partial [uncultured bacterium]
TKLHSDFVEFLESITLAALAKESEWQKALVKNAKRGGKKKQCKFN